MKLKRLNVRWAHGQANAIICVINNRIRLCIYNVKPFFNLLVSIRLFVKQKWEIEVSLHTIPLKQSLSEMLSALTILRPTFKLNGRTSKLTQLDFNHLANKAGIYKRRWNEEVSRNTRRESFDNKST